MASDRGSDAGWANPRHGAEDHTQQAVATVLCPKGHVNAWNYKFCGECGAPIGLVPWPSDDSPSAEAPRARPRVPLVVVGAVVAVIAVVVAAVAFVMMRPARDDPGSSGSTLGTAAPGASASQTGQATCSDDPLLEAESIDLTSEGLEVSAAFMSACGGRDVESNRCA